MQCQPYCWLAAVAWLWCSSTSSLPRGALHAPPLTPLCVPPTAVRHAEPHLPRARLPGAGQLPLRRTVQVLPGCPASTRVVAASKLRQGGHNKTGPLPKCSVRIGPVPSSARCAVSASAHQPAPPPCNHPCNPTQLGKGRRDGDLCRLRARLPGALRQDAHLLPHRALQHQGILHSSSTNSSHGAAAPPWHLDCKSSRHKRDRRRLAWAPAAAATPQHTLPTQPPSPPSAPHAGRVHA